MSKKIVYIAHPYRHDPAGNVEKVKKICQQIQRKYNGEVIPLAPHLVLSYLDESGGSPDKNKQNREEAMDHCRALLKLCDELWICSRHISDGMVLEFDWAKEEEVEFMFMDF